MKERLRSISQEDDICEVLKSEEYSYPDNHEYYYNSVIIVNNVSHVPIFLPSGNICYESDMVTRADCTSSQFRCDNGQCTSSSYRCNGATGGCNDGSDERGCSKLAMGKLHLSTYQSSFLPCSLFTGYCRIFAIALKIA